MTAFALRRGLTGAVVLAASAASAIADPLGTLLSKGNGSACFERVYDPAHLQKHPKQETREMLLSLVAEGGDPDGATLRIRIRQNSRNLYMIGECAYSAKANLDVMDKPLIQAFKGPSGLDCHAYASTDPGSAEEGGDFPIDLRDGAAIVVYFPDELAAWSSLDRPVEADFPHFGAEDQIFKLNRTATASCRDLVSQLPSMQ
jgi:hypothetical protein